jgi:cholesterol oxidase
LGVSSRIFTLDTIGTNLVEHLVENGYDVWLLDYRASIELPTASRSLTADVIATIDYPEAVSEVRRLTGAPSVQMVVHCFGATVFFISVLSGALQDVRSAVVSQATPHLDAASMVRLKSTLRIAWVLRALGKDTLTARTDADTGVIGRLWDAMLRAYPLPEVEKCDSPVCRRVSFLYSRLYEHDQLSPETHDTLHELFGVCSLAATQQVCSMVLAGHLVDFDGEDVYMEHVDRLAFPIRFVHGAENACFGPRGSQQSYEWVVANNGPDLYSRVVIPEFGHIDCILGERAVTEVFPHIVDHLDQHA